MNSTLCILCERPFLDEFPLSNPSAFWLQEFMGEGSTFVMRGASQYSEVSDVVSLPSSSSTFDFLKKFLIDSKFRSESREVIARVLRLRESADALWVRGPALIPLLLSGIWMKKYALKSRVHICANRLTIAYAFRAPSVINFLRLFYGFLLVGILRLASRRGAQFYYTGTHVRKAFGLTNAKFLIDFVPRKAVKVKPRAGGVYLGRLDKISDNSEFKSIAMRANAPLDVYGPGELKDDLDCYSLKGVVNPLDVQDVLSSYIYLVCITNAYYEGFPRVLAEAIDQEMCVVVNRDASFIGDLIGYPKLIFSDEFNEPLVLQKNANFDEQAQFEFVHKIRKSSLLNVE